MPRVPGHRYLGPGNTLNEGNPIDEDDLIAKIHDIEYEYLPETINQHGEIAIDNFLNNFVQTGNWHSILGGLGLQVKRQYESVFGQQYPMPHGGQDDYTGALRELSKLYKEEKARGTKTSWKEFQQLYFGDLLREQLDRRVHGGSTSDTINIQHYGDNSAGTSSSAKRARSDVNATPERSGDQSLFDDDLDNIINSTMADMDVETMETIANPSQGGGVTSNSNSGHGSGRSAGVGTIVNIPRNPKTEYITRSFSKHWIFYSYGFINKQVVGNDEINYITPLMLIPVDCLLLYMDPCEFINLRGKSVAVHCNARIRPLGCRMNFQTNASTTSWATSEFVAIGQKAIGLNIGIPGRNREYSPEASKPMSVSTHTFPDMAKLNEKLYGATNGTSGAQLVPRHLNMYFTPITAVRNPTTGSDFRHSNRPPKIDQYVDRFLINSAVGQTIIDYEYKPRMGILHDVRFNQLKHKFKTAPLSQAVQLKPTVTSGQSVEGIIEEHSYADADSNEVTQLPGWQNSFLSSIAQTIELQEHYNWDKGHTHGNVQPQVHVGLTAVPAINPGTDTTDYQNTACYWAVDTQIVIHEYVNSAYHYGQGIHTTNPDWYPPKYTKKYYSGLSFSHHANLVKDAQYAISPDYPMYEHLTHFDHITSGNVARLPSQRDMDDDSRRRQRNRFIADERKESGSGASRSHIDESSFVHLEIPTTPGLRRATRFE
ncbi:uncharacterized protein LOC109855740 [Pseudomyrmex gracilis]|uniref:uncharacterized protein LOC109855740 n=1 Tax=Pseudomyrmex gracilis TaxID=219809 RepID=UPI0009952935|nr:uncharacterized protein LOC109855740 [Pseudomyrmex gracilis]